MSLTLDQCQKMIVDLAALKGWDVKDVSYQGLGFAEESGEVCKALRDMIRFGKTPERQEHLAQELADVLMFLCQFATDNNINLSDAFAAKVNRVASKAAA